MIVVFTIDILMDPKAWRNVVITEHPSINRRLMVQDPLKQPANPVKPYKSQHKNHRQSLNPTVKSLLLLNPNPEYAIFCIYCITFCIYCIYCLFSLWYLILRVMMMYLWWENINYYFNNSFLFLTHHV